MKCKKCAYWFLGRRSRYNTVIFPPNPFRNFELCDSEDEAANIFGGYVRRCHCPKLLFYQRPSKDGAAVCDGSEYHAELITGEDFGCVNWKPLDETF